MRSIVQFVFLLTAFVSLWQPAGAQLLSVDAQARLLAGLPSAEPGAQAIEATAAWQSGQRTGAASLLRSYGFLTHAKVDEYRNFAQHNFHEAYEHGNKVLYLFGGADFPFADTFFPYMHELVIVGLEPVGHLPNPAVLAATGGLGKEMHDIAWAFRSLAGNTYFITKNMAVELREFGTQTMLTVGLVSMGYHIDGVQAVSLNSRGELDLLPPGHAARSLRIYYSKPDGLGQRSLVYLSQDLSNGSLQRNPGLPNFIKQEKFDVAFYKAASFVSHDGAFTGINSLVTNNVHYILQSDDGMPFSSFDLGKWKIELFGLYAMPGPIFYRHYETDYLRAFASSICQSQNPAAISAMSRIWEAPLHFGVSFCSHFTPLPNVIWRGEVPVSIRIGYSPFNGAPIPRDIRARSTNIIYARPIYEP